MFAHDQPSASILDTAAELAGALDLDVDRAVSWAVVWTVMVTVQAWRETVGPGGARRVAGVPAPAQLLQDTVASSIGIDQAGQPFLPGGGTGITSPGSVPISTRSSVGVLNAAVAGSRSVAATRSLT